jgi:radical SAM protein with 4Fe4S-binding SPASM domain
MDINKIQFLFDKIEKAEVPIVTLTGGEPLLEPDLLIECIKQCSERNIVCSINTNLVPLTDRMLSKMLEVGKFSILTSLSSNIPSVHDFLMNANGRFSKTIDGINLIHKAGVNFSINMVVTKINADHVYQTGLLALQLGAGKFCATKANPPLGCIDYSMVQPTHEQVKDSLDVLLALNKDTGIRVDALECYPLCFLGDLEKYEPFTKRRCSAGVASGSIGPEGGFRPCSHSNRIYGDVFSEDSIEDIFARMTDWRSGELIPETCKKCSYFKRCSGGCRCEAEYVCKIEGMDPYACGEGAVLPGPIVNYGIIADDRPVFFPKNIQIRSESFGCIIHRNGNLAMIDQDAGKIFSNYIGIKTNPSEIAKDYCCDIVDTARLISILLSKRIIELA